MERINREELGKEYARFGRPCSDRMLQHLQASIGLKPTYEGAIGRSGRVAKYDPIDAWVMATAEFGRKGSWTDGSARLDQVAELYAHAIKVEGAGDIPGFLDDEALGMKLVYVTRWQYGFPFEDLMRCLAKDSELYELSTFEPDYLRSVLQAYRIVLGQTITGMPLPGFGADSTDEPDKTERYFVEAWVKQAGELFRLRSASSDPEPEGGGA